MRTQVGIVGAGPAGLLLSHLLHLQGIESVVLELRTRSYIEQRIRAGVLEQTTVDLLTETGLGERLHREGLRHNGIELRFNGRGHRIDFAKLTGGRAVTVYGQQEVVKDLIATRLADNGQILFETQNVSVHDIDRDKPSIAFSRNGENFVLQCDIIAGCDGFHGICRNSIADTALTVYERIYPFAWLGILAKAPPASHELIYAAHERGFALHSLRSPYLSRNYIQCDPGDRLEDWPDARVWEEMQTRFATASGFRLNEGPVVEKIITAMRSFVVQPMQYGKLYLAGDAAHIVPPTGAKGMNLAMADVRVLAEALGSWYKTGETRHLENYSATCLRRIWRVQHFSWWMTSMLHKFDEDPFSRQLQLSQLAYISSSEAAAKSLAENYVGLESVAL